MANPGGFIWYELTSPDPAASKTFYDAVVGWNLDVDRVAPETDYRMIKRADGGTAGGVLTLTEEMRAGGGRPIWLGYLHTRDVDATVEAIRADGGQVMRPPWDQPGVGRLAMVSGPEGAPFYLMDPLPPEGDPGAASDVFSVDQPQHVRWNELWSSDPEASVAFYLCHFGWGQEGDMDMGEMGKYQFIQHDGVMIGAIMPAMPDMPQSMWNFYIGVDDIDRAAAAVKSGGGQIVNGPMEIPGGEYAVNAVDPQGAHVGFVGPRKQ
ncbi:MAG: VOC family protein [Pseudomonadota bacterium]|nr:VOC family protein [Pseudomonadota bacterium]